MGGYKELAAAEARRILKKVHKLKLEFRGKAVLRLVQQVEAALHDIFPEELKRRLPVGAFRPAFPGVLLEQAGARLPAEFVEAPEFRELFERSQLPRCGGIAFGARAGDIEHFVALFLDDLFFLPPCQQVVENIVAGYGAAYGRQFARPECAPLGMHGGVVEIVEKFFSELHDRPAEKLLRAIRRREKDLFGALSRQLRIPVGFPRRQQRVVFAVVVFGEKQDAPPVGNDLRSVAGDRRLEPPVGQLPQRNRVLLYD